MADPTEVTVIPSCEAVPLVEASVPTAHQVPSQSHSEEDVQTYEWAHASDMDMVLLPGFVIITAVEATHIHPLPSYLIMH